MESLTGNVNVAKVNKIWLQGNTVRKLIFRKPFLPSTKYTCAFFTGESNGQNFALQYECKKFQHLP